MALLESVTDGALGFDREGRFTFVNAKAEAILGKTAAELVGHDAQQVCPEGIDDDFYAKCGEALHLQTLITYEAWCDRLHRWLEVRIYPTINGLIILLQDISEQKQREVEMEQNYDELEHELIRHLLKLRQAKVSLYTEALGRKRAEEALKVTNAKLASVLESITDGVCALDHEWRFTYVNYRAAEILRCSQNELAGKVIWELYPYLQTTTFYQRSLEVAQNGVPTQFEENFQPLNLWMEFRIYPSPEGISVSFHDITPRKQAELALQRSLQQAEQAQERFTFLSNLNRALANSLNVEQTFATMLQSVVPFLADYCVIEQIEGNSRLRPLAVLHCNSEKQELVEQVAACYQQFVEFSNSYTAQALQRGEPILVSEVSDELVSSMIQDEWLLKLCRQLNPKSIMVIPLLVQKRFVGTMLLAMAESGRRYTEVELMLAEDVADCAAVALDNAQFQNQVEELNRLKDEFLGSLSHELRTPLNAILGWAQLLNQRSLPDHVFRKGLETIERKSKDLSQIINDLLDMSCIAAGRLHVNIENVNLSVIVQEAIASLKLAIEAKSIVLKVEIDSSLSFMQGDPDRLRQIVWHLLSNAIKFTSPEGQITIRLHHSDRTIQLEISDCGTGIRNSFLPHVFDPFRQANGSTTRLYGGLGVGLSLVRHLVEQHGGNISVFSQGENQGTTVKVTLPVLEQTNSEQS